MNNLYLSSALFIAQGLARPSKQPKVKNPNLPEANQLATHKCGRWFELGTTNQNSGQSGTQTPHRWIASPTRWPLAHEYYIQRHSMHVTGRWGL